MKVLLWSPHGAGEHYGGPGTSAFRLYAQPAASDLEVTLAHGYPGQEAHPEVFAEQHLVAPAVKNVLVRFGPFGVPHPGRSLRHERFLRSAGHFIRGNANRYDVFHGLMAYEQTVQPAFAAERAGLPAVVKVAQHGAELAVRGALSRLLGRVERRRSKLASLHGVIALTRAIAEELIQAGVPEAAIACIPNGVDTVRFRPATGPEEVRALRRRLGWHDLPTALFVGSIIPRKRPHLLLDALDGLVRSGFDCQLALVGPATDSGYLRTVERRVSTLGLRGLVQWLDFRRDIEICYRAADVFCLPSRAEGLSNATLEAMSSGLPVILTAVSGAAEVSEGATSGVVLPEASAPAIGEALRLYFDDDGRREAHGRSARCKVTGRFSQERVLELHRRLFQQLLRGGRPAEVAPP